MDLTRSAVLRTARLVLRPVQPEDAANLIAGIGQLDVSRFLTVVPHPYGLADFDHYLTIARPGFHWAITDADGHCGGISLDPGLGFWIAPDRQGRGYVTEAARAVLAMHFAGPAAEAVRSGYFADNQASAQVHRKLGFECVGVEQSLCRALGQPRPLLRQCLTREAWEANGGLVGLGIDRSHSAGQSLG